MQADTIQSKALKEGAIVTVYRHYCLTHTVTYSYKLLLNILHNTESWKRPKLLCINHQCHIDAPLWNTARYYSLACYKVCLIGAHHVWLFVHVCSCSFPYKALLVSHSVNSN